MLQCESIRLRMDTSEQPDTAKGKNMAQSQVTESAKTVLIAVYMGLILVAGWTGYASYLGFEGRLELTNLAHVTLSSLSIGAIGFMVFGAFYLRKQ